MTDADPTIRFSDRVSADAIRSFEMPIDPCSTGLACSPAQGRPRTCPDPARPATRPWVVAITQLFHHIARHGRVVRLWELEQAA